jgi:hypothetical protein
MLRAFFGITFSIILKSHFIVSESSFIYENPEEIVYASGPSLPKKSDCGLTPASLENCSADNDYKCCYVNYSLCLIAHQDPYVSKTTAYYALKTKYDGIINISCGKDKVPKESTCGSNDPKAPSDCIVNENCCFVSGNSVSDNGICLKLVNRSETRDKDKQWILDNYEIGNRQINCGLNKFPSSNTCGYSDSLRSCLNNNSSSKTCCLISNEKGDKKCVEAELGKSTSAQKAYDYIKNNYDDSVQKIQCQIEKLPEKNECGLTNNEKFDALTSPNKVTDCTLDFSKTQHCCFLKNSIGSAKCVLSPNTKRDDTKYTAESKITDIFEGEVTCHDSFVTPKDYNDCGPKKGSTIFGKSVDMYKFPNKASDCPSDDKGVCCYVVPSEQISDKKAVCLKSEFISDDKAQARNYIQQKFGYYVKHIDCEARYIFIHLSILIIGLILLI